VPEDPLDDSGIVDEGDDLRQASTGSCASASRVVWSGRSPCRRCRRARRSLSSIARSRCTLLVARSLWPLRTEPTRSRTSSVQLGGCRLPDDPLSICSMDSRTMADCVMLRRFASAARRRRRAAGNLIESPSISEMVIHSVTSRNTGAATNLGRFTGKGIELHRRCYSSSMCAASTASSIRAHGESQAVSREDGGQRVESRIPLL
jgi:hypothetical protein